MRITVLISFFLLVMAGCKSQKANSEDGDANQDSTSALTVLMSDNYGGAEVEEMQVIRSQKELDKYFIKVNMARKPGLKPPEVDFSKDLVIAYCTGKTTRQELPELMINDAAENAMMISRKQGEVTENQESTAILMPFCLYIMPITDKQILLQEKSSP